MDRRGLCAFLFAPDSRLKKESIVVLSIKRYHRYLEDGVNGLGAKKSKARTFWNKIPDKMKWQIPQLEARHVEKVEALIDEINKSVGPLENFILPGGSPGAANLHLARTICRRAERDVTTLTRIEPIGTWVLPYLNRLSDLLFVMARFENKERQVPEPLWDTKL